MTRTAIAALAEQQALLTQQGETIRAQARRIAAQDATAQNLLGIVRAQQGEIDRITKGLQTLSALAGGEIESKIAGSMGLTFVADDHNPAQPVPEPPAVAPTESTVETKTPEAMADVTTPGLVPGSTQDVAADVTTTGYTPGQDVPGPAFKNLQDVTAPIDGTQTARPLNETRTETDVRVGDPMNPQTAYPLRGGFQNAQRTSGLQNAPQGAQEAPQSPQSLRTYASLRLARLRMQAGLEQTGSDLELAQRIEKDASLSGDAIEREIKTLSAVVQRTASRQALERSSKLVPKSASVRPKPSLAGGGALPRHSDEDEFLFVS
jgi:hypothetical protein